jgi:hypothetical protein
MSLDENPRLRIKKLNEAGDVLAQGGMSSSFTMTPSHPTVPGLGKTRMRPLNPEQDEVSLWIC